MLNGLSSGAMGDTSRSRGTDARKCALVDVKPVWTDGGAAGVNYEAMTSVLSRAYQEALDCGLSGLRPNAMHGVVKRVSPEAVNGVVNGVDFEALNGALHNSTWKPLKARPTAKAAKVWAAWPASEGAAVPQRELPRRHLEPPAQQRGDVALQVRGRGAGHGGHRHASAASWGSSTGRRLGPHHGAGSPRRAWGPGALGRRVRAIASPVGCWSVGWLVARPEEAPPDDVVGFQLAVELSEAVYHELMKICARMEEAAVWPHGLRPEECFSALEGILQPEAAAGGARPPGVAPQGRPADHQRDAARGRDDGRGSARLSFRLEPLVSSASSRRATAGT